MLFDKLLGKKEKILKRRSRKDEVTEQVKKLLTEEDQKIILMVR